MKPAVLQRGLDQAPSFLKRFRNGIPSENILLVCGRHSFQASGAEAWFAEAGLGDLPRFDDFAINPKEEDVIQGLQVFHQIQAKAVIGVGGGSTLDMAKLLAYFGSTGTTLSEYLEHGRPASPSLSPLLAVPITAGTGSEATHFAVVYRGTRKYSVADPALLPDAVWLVPEWTASMSPYQTACTGMDALAQGIESLWANGATPESRGFARQAVHLALHTLPTVVEAPTPDARADMQEAAYLAGAGINISKTTGAHAFSYILTSQFDLPHGHAVALLLPFFVDLHQRAGITVEGVTRDRLSDLLRRIHLARTLPVDASTLTAILLDNVNMERLSNNPVPVTPEFISSVARHLTGKKEET